MQPEIGPSHTMSHSSCNMVYYYHQPWGRSMDSMDIILFYTKTV